jgi:PAS domain S-box-containing protein
MNLNHIVDNLDRVIIGVDESWRYTYINAGAERALKRPAGELLGCIIWDCHPEAVGTEFERQCRRAMEERDASSIAGKGMLDTLAISILPIDGGISIVSSPIPEIAGERWEKAVPGAAATLDALDSPIAILDAGGVILSANRAWREALGARHIAPVGTDYPAYCDALADHDIAEAGRLADGIRMMMKGAKGDDELFSMELPLPPAGAERWYRSRVTRFRGEGNGGLVVTHEEITDLQRARIELEERESMLRHQLHLTTTIAHKAAEALFLMDRDGRLTFVNASAEEMFGWARREMLGKRLHDLVHYRHPDSTPYPIKRCPLQKVFSRGVTVHNHEDTFYHKSGYPIFVACSNAPVMDSGMITGAVLVVRDISEHKRAADILRDTEERYRMVARATNDVIWDWDLVHDEILWNEAIQTVFHHAPERMTTDGDWWKERIHPDDRERIVSTIHDAIEGRGEAWTGEYRFRAHDGSYATIFDRGHIYRNQYGQAVRLIGSMLDLTERKLAEEALQRAKEEAEAAIRAKDRFLAVLSHELRTPLTPALASIQALEDAGLSTDVRPFVEIIHRNIELEARLIDDLLDLTRIARGKVEMLREVVDLHAIVRNVVETCHGDIRQKHILLWQSLAASRHHVWGDSARLHQVLWNVLKNAIKFTPDGGSVTIRTDNRDGGEAFTIIVTDTGIGIDRDVLPMIFDAFMQGEEQINRRFGGLGLGLAISKSLVEMHGGTITASSDGWEKGTTVTVELPVASTSEAPGQARDDEPAGTFSPHVSILLVDDNIDTLDVLRIILERRGLRVQTAASVSSALDLAARQRFDLLVSDIGLPDGTGHDLIRALRARGPIKAIAISGFGMDEDVQHSIDAGFHDHLIKPVNIRKLEETIARLLESDEERGKDGSGGRRG